MTTATSARALEGRVALITGASRGIGAAVAERFAAAGAHVILLGRTAGALEEVDDRIRESGGTATLLPFDLLESRKIAALGPALADKFGRLDILVGNAGMLGTLSPVAMSEPKVYEETFKLNFFANYHLIRALDPLLRGSDAGRAIFVTSGAAQKSRPFWSAYAASKAALDVMVRTYAAEVAHSPLKVNIVNPGAVRTDMRAAAFPAEKAEDIAPPADVTDVFLKLALPDCATSGETVSAQAA